MLHIPEFIANELLYALLLDVTMITAFWWTSSMVLGLLLPKGALRCLTSAAIYTASK